jgi:GNAT superfamily N-acetyltransferase
MKLLKDNQKYFEEIITLVEEKWSFLNFSREKWLNMLDPFKTGTGIPSCYMALDDSNLIGFITIQKKLPTNHFPNLSPCLHIVYVKKEFRKTGIGGKIVKFAENKIKEWGYKNLYLYTADKVKFYKNLGWEELNHFNNNGNTLVLMKRKLNL